MVHQDDEPPATPELFARSLDLKIIADIGMELSANLGKLLLRLTLGGLMLLHGLGKMHAVPAGIMDRLANAGFPSALGYLVYVGEVLAPLLLIVGLWTRAAALLGAGKFSIGGASGKLN